MFFTHAANDSFSASSGEAPANATSAGANQKAIAKMAPAIATTSVLATVETYDPATDTWAPAPAMTPHSDSVIVQ